MTNNPILRRELKSALRTRVALMLAAAYLVILAGVIWMMWPASGVYSQAEQASRSIVLAFTVTQLMLVILYAPAFAATAITAEKEQRSYELLFATLLRPVDIVAGKLWSSILCLVIFVVLSFPFFASCFFLGAVSGKETALIYLIAVVSAVFFGLLGLSISALARRSQSALIWTYLAILLVCALPWVPYVLLQNWAEGAKLVYSIRSVSPLAAIASVLIPTFRTPPGLAAGVLPTPWKVYFLFVAVASAGMVVFLLINAYWPVSSRIRPQAKTIDDPRELARRKLSFPFYLFDPMRRRRNIPDWMNPIFAREMRNKAFGGGIWIFRSAYLCFAVSVVLIALVAGQLGRQTPDVIRIVALAFQIGLIVLVVPSLTAGAITQEREKMNLDLLRLTRLRAGQFLRGKLQVAMVFLLFLVIGFLPLWYAILYLETNTLEQILRCWAIIGATMVLTLATGLFCSSLVRRTAAATATAYGILLLLSVATFFPALMPGRIGGSLAELIYALNPFVCAIQGLTSEYFQRLPDLWARHLQLSLGLSLVFALAALIRVRRMLSPES